MTTHSSLSGAASRRSSYSDGGDNNCVEVADDMAGVVPVRDSKNPSGPALRIPAASWSAFTATVKATR
ncbi:DUF397 domain-containing protein [Streptomyces sp. NPDC048650]|uniref:DUF397 domain-containing protein n=1 Tax=unclassified Streptomyces TaxID=2593676 RepID=UPI003720D89C